jgi:Na+/H+ antiporter NhaD/arsenite permease-like protein
MPAGVYSIEQISPAGVIQITNTNTGATAMVIGNPLGTISNEAGKVTFTKEANGYALGMVTLPNGASYGLPLHAAAR